MARGREEVYREVERLVSLGRVGEATRRLVSPGLASETPAVKARLLSKFPSRDEATDLACDAVVQPPEIPLESIYASIYSFRKGAGPGPDGIRGDFLRDMIGQQSHDDSMARLFRDMVQLLADGQAPPFLRPFFGGGRLVGVGKKDASGNPISLETDARPIVLGLTWRKLIFKVSFALDGAGIRERLGDHQLALTKNGAVIMVHATRAWAPNTRIIRLLSFCKKTSVMPLMKLGHENSCANVGRMLLLPLDLPIIFTLLAVIWFMGVLSNSVIGDNKGVP